MANALATIRACPDVDRWNALAGVLGTEVSCTERALNLILENVCTVAAFRTSFLALLESDVLRTAFLCGGAAAGLQIGAPPPLEATLRTRVLPATTVVCFRADADDRCAPVLRQAGWGTLVAASLRLPGTPLFGVLAAADPELLWVSEPDLQLFQLLAHAATWHLERRDSQRRLLAANRQLACANQQLRRLAITDHLTGLYNHRFFQDRLSEELARAKRYQRPLGLIMADVDHFKLYNDTFGHPAGDHALIQIASLIAQNVRAVDVVVRYGGEEFAVILPEANLTATFHSAERIRAAVAAADFRQDEDPLLSSLTISLGGAAFPDSGLEASQLLKVADHALYAAKQAGRNRTTIASPTALPPAHLPCSCRICSRSREQYAGSSASSVIPSQSTGQGSA